MKDDKRLIFKMLGILMKTVNIKPAAFCKMLWHVATAVFIGMTLGCVLDIIKVTCLS